MDKVYTFCSWKPGLLNPIVMESPQPSKARQGLVMSGTVQTDAPLQLLSKKKSAVSAGKVTFKPSLTKLLRALP
ncbi:hypothetical protein [Pedobacter nanyangensis]|uniref:hypothetical protein n=1 Tax=Pedobacter nanyangensis TaxID=1562389 RepID=UPI000DE4D9AC|nr:hypothetical protein [Pedobacter nanyangensis]